MKKEDEIKLMEILQARSKKWIKGGRRFQQMPYIRDLVEKLEIHPNRANYILYKWSEKSLLNCGVSVFAGWLTEKGLDLDIEKWKTK